MIRAVLLCCSCTLAAPSDKEVFTRPTPGVPCTTTVYRKGGNTSEGTLDVECTRGWGIIDETLNPSGAAAHASRGVPHRLWQRNGELPSWETFNGGETGIPFDKHRAHFCGRGKL